MLVVANSFSDKIATYTNLKIAVSSARATHGHLTRVKFQIARKVNLTLVQVATTGIWHWNWTSQLFEYPSNVHEYQSRKQYSNQLVVYNFILLPRNILKSGLASLLLMPTSSTLTTTNRLFLQSSKNIIQLNVTVRQNLTIEKLI